MFKGVFITEDELTYLIEEIDKADENLRKLSQLINSKEHMQNDLIKNITSSLNGVWIKLTT